MSSQYYREKLQQLINNREEISNNINNEIDNLEKNLMEQIKLLIEELKSFYDVSLFDDINNLKSLDNSIVILYKLENKINKVQNTFSL